MSTVEQFLNANNCTFEEGSISREVLDSKINSRNRNEIDFTMECGHKKTCKASSFTVKPHCVDCSLMEKYGYDAEKETLTCKKCGKIDHEVPRTNLHKHVCNFCGREDSTDFTFFKFVSELFEGEDNYITRNAQYDVDARKKPTADAKIVHSGKDIFVEIDDANHVSSRSCANHKKKDVYAAEMEMPLLRIFKADVNKETVVYILNFIVEFIDEIDTDYPVLFITSDAARKFYSHKNLDYEVAVKDYPFVQNHEKTYRLVPEEEEEGSVLTLKEEFFCRMMELAEFIGEKEQELLGEDSIPFKVFVEGMKISSLAGTDQCDPKDLYEATQKFLYAATSVLLFNNRKIDLKYGQKVEETEIEKKEEIEVENDVLEEESEITKI